MSQEITVYSTPGIYAALKSTLDLVQPKIVDESVKSFFVKVNRVSKIAMRLSTDILLDQPTHIQLQFVNSISAFSTHLIDFSGRHINETSIVIRNYDEEFKRLVITFDNFQYSTLLIHLFNNNTKMDDVSSYIDEIKAQMTINAKNVEGIADEMSVLLKSTRSAASEVVITEYAMIFDNATKKFNKSADVWFWSTIGVVALVISFALIFALSLKLDKSDSAAQIVQFSVSKVLVFAVLFYLLSIFVRNYRANKHNAITNEHRMNALASFEAFVKSAKDEDAVLKNAILMEVTKTIFSSQQTGYLSSENDTENSTRVFEVVKNVMSSK